MEYSITSIANSVDQMISSSSSLVVVDLTSSTQYNTTCSRIHLYVVVQHEEHACSRRTSLVVVALEVR